MSGTRYGYPLRPEVAESVMYLYRATRDPLLLDMGADIVASIRHSARTSCGYATVRNVHTHQLEDRMESFFLAETVKYLYLLFAPDHWIHDAGGSGVVVDVDVGAGGRRQCVVEAGGFVCVLSLSPVSVRLKPYFKILYITNFLIPYVLLPLPRPNLVAFG